MKKILVLGATGHLGCYSAVHLAQQGNTVVAVGHRKSDNGFFASKGIKYIGGFSLENASDYDLLPTDINAVVHLAGTMPAHANESPMPYIQSIVVGMANLCEWLAKKTNCKRIVFNTTPSDVCAYFGTDAPVNDDAIRSFPKNGGDHAVYAIAKNTACDLLEHYRVAYGITYCVFRHLTIYCYYPDPSYSLNGVKKIVPWRIIMNKAMKNEDIEIWGDKDSKKELLYMKDFVRAIECGVNSNEYGYFNISGDRPYTLEEQIQGLIDVFCDQYNPSKKIYCPNKPSSPQNLLESNKIRCKLGWKPIYNWWTACEDMKQEMNNEPMALLWGVKEDYRYE